VEVRVDGPLENANENRTRKKTGIASVQKIISPSRWKYQVKFIRVCVRNMRKRFIALLPSARRSVL
jgi:hypothetical protein